MNGIKDFIYLKLLNYVLLELHYNLNIKIINIYSTFILV